MRIAKRSIHFVAFIACCLTATTVLSLPQDAQAATKTITCSNGKTIQFEDPDNSATTKDYDQACKTKGNTGYGNNPNLKDVDNSKGGSNCNARFLTFPAWYNGVTDENCTPSPKALGGEEDTQLSRFIWKIVLNIIDIMLQLVGYLCIGYIIYGGWRYLTSAGQADGIAAGRKLILNAVIGLILSFFAVAFVSIIGASIE